MKKLRLRLDDLRVDTFETSTAEASRGTVLGQQQCTCDTQCTCPGCPTCYETCPESCGGTCEQSCRGTCFATCDFNCAPSEGGYSCATSPYPNQPCFPC